MHATKMSPGKHTCRLGDRQKRNKFDNSNIANFYCKRVLNDPNKEEIKLFKLWITTVLCSSHSYMDTTPDLYQIFEVIRSSLEEKLIQHQTRMTLPAAPHVM